MSYCRKEGKDIIIFATEEDHKEPSNVTLPEPEPQPGLILPDGSINWNCPCLGGMATGPCGVQFREAFSCFHYSKEDPKGSDCFDAFRVMQECMAQYPSLYNQPDDDDNDAFNTELIQSSENSDEMSNDFGDTTSRSNQSRSTEDSGINSNSSSSNSSSSSSNSTSSTNSIRISKANLNTN